MATKAVLQRFDMAICDGLRAGRFQVSMTFDGSLDDFDDNDEIFLDPGELTDRRGRIDQHIVDGDVVLTRVPDDQGRETHEVVRYNIETRLLRIFPKSYRSGGLEPQFRSIVELQIEDSDWNPSAHSEEHAQYNLLSARGLPRGFNTIYDFGLGIQKHYRAFVDLVEEHSSPSILRLVSDDSEGTGDDGQTLRVRMSRFADYRAAVDRYRERGWTVVRRVIDAETHNSIATLFDLPAATPVRGQHPMVRLMTEEVETGHVMAAPDRELLADAVTASAPTLGAEAPGRLLKLREDIELVTLDGLISRFESDLSGGHANDEAHWQRFFNENRFALQMLFAAPVVVEWDQAHVAAGDPSGRGGRIVDFLCANVLTRSVHLVEIKTPGMKLMGAVAYRGDGTESAIYAPYRFLTEAVAQAQSQMASIPRAFAGMLPSNSTVDPWAQTRGAVIAGRLATLTDEQKESFIRYRDGLSAVTVLAYDEVLERLKSLQTMLGSPPAPEALHAS